MRGGTRVGMAALAVATLVAACNGEQGAATVPPYVPAPPPSSPAAAFDGPRALVVQSQNETLGWWEVSPDGTTVVYRVSSGGGTALHGVDTMGRSWKITDLWTGARPEFVDENHVAIVERKGSGEGTRLRLAEVDGSQTSVVADIDHEVVVVGDDGTELVYAIARNRRTVFNAWNHASGETREVGSVEHRPSGLDQAELIHDSIVFEIREGPDGLLKSMRLDDGATVDLPRHDPILGFGIVGEAPDGHVVLVEDGREGDFIYTVDLADPMAITDLATDAIRATIEYTGATVQFENRGGEARELDLATGENTPIAFSDAVRPAPQPIAGLTEARVWDVLPNGNWVVTGRLVDGEKYRTVWNFNEGFNDGERYVADIAVKAVFEYEPATETLWMISGAPDYAETTTQSGSGVSPGGVLRVAVMEGLVAYSTGFSGAAYDIEHNLYLAPLGMSDG